MLKQGKLLTKFFKDQVLVTTNANYDLADGKTPTDAFQMRIPDDLEPKPFQQLILIQVATSHYKISSSKNQQANLQSVLFAGFMLITERPLFTDRW